MTRMQREERRTMLIDVALKLFMERGYNNVSVQDILDIVDGQNGMFYHHFKTKEEIYTASIERFINLAAQARIAIITDKSKTIQQRLEHLFEDIQTDAGIFVESFGKPIDQNFLTQVMIGFLNAMVKPVALLFIEAKKDGIIEMDSIINEETAEAAARFALYGCNGLTMVLSEERPEEQSIRFMIPFIMQFLKINTDKLD